MASTNIWNPQLEAKLSAWHQMQKVADKAKPAPCITISREFGCQAYPLAAELTRRLNSQTCQNKWVVIGKEIIEEVAELSGFSIDQIEKSQDTPASLKAFFSMFLDRSRADETEVFPHMRSVIRNFAERGNCILVGRGGVCVTQDLSNCVHVRLVAPYQFRLRNIMTGHGLNEKEAEKYIALHQKQRQDFVRRFTGKNTDDPELFHLVMNNARMSVTKIATVIENYLGCYLDHS